MEDVLVASAVLDVEVIVTIILLFNRNRCKLIARTCPCQGIILRSCPHGGIRCAYLNQLNLGCAAQPSLGHLPSVLVRIRCRHFHAASAYSLVDHLPPAVGRASLSHLQAASPARGSTQINLGRVNHDSVASRQPWPG